jgi:hypothetical protein
MEVTTVKTLTGGKETVKLLLLFLVAFAVIGLIDLQPCNAVQFTRTQSGEPGICSSDSKLLNGGPTLVFGEGPGTWWGLVENGLVEAGFADEPEQIAYLNQVFGTSFDALDELRDYNLQLVEDNWDLNQNGYVCAYELRGTRAYLGDPFINLTFFGISDDKVRKK